LLFSIVFFKINFDFALIFFIIGSLLHFYLTLKILSIWIQNSDLDIKHLNAGWFLPVVGNIIIAIAGFNFNFIYNDILWFFFTIGLVLGGALFFVFIYRIIFHMPLSKKILPTFFILIAPPSLGFIAYTQLVGVISEVSKMLYFFGLFLFILFIYQFKMFKKLGFYISWWAYSFPIATLTIATIIMYSKLHSLFYYYIMLFFILFLSIIIIFLIINTIHGILKKEFCV